MLVISRELLVKTLKECGYTFDEVMVSPTSVRKIVCVTRFFQTSVAGLTYKWYSCVVYCHNSRLGSQIQDCVISWLRRFPQKASAPWRWDFLTVNQSWTSELIILAKVVTVTLDTLQTLYAFCDSYITYVTLCQSHVCKHAVRLLTLDFRCLPSRCWEWRPRAAHSLGLYTPSFLPARRGNAGGSRPVQARDSDGGPEEDEAEYCEVCQDDPGLLGTTGGRKPGKLSPPPQHTAALCSDIGHCSAYMQTVNVFYQRVSAETCYSDHNTIILFLISTLVLIDRHKWEDCTLHPPITPPLILKHLRTVQYFMSWLILC